MLGSEFKKKFDAETDASDKEAVKQDFLLFMKKMDSIENVALIGALLKVKNLEDLGRIKSVGNPDKNSEPNTPPDQSADYPGGIDTLREEVANLFYKEGVYSEVKTVKANVIFTVEKDGRISNVHAQGDNFTFNRQAEIALYSVSEKFSPAIYKGYAIQSRFNLPLIMQKE